MSVYLDAIKVLEECGWHQGWPGVGPNGERCMAQAVVAADPEAASYANRRLAHMLGVEFVGDWNDDPSTSYEDVVLALKRAHEATEVAS